MSNNSSESRVRLRLVPATVSWVFAALFLIGMISTTYYAYKRFPIKYPDSPDFVRSCYLSLLKPPASLMSAVVMWYAGRQSLRRRWIDVSVCYGIVIVLMAILMVRLGIK